MSKRRYSKNEPFIKTERSDSVQLRDRDRSRRHKDQVRNRSRSPRRRERDINQEYDENPKRRDRYIKQEGNRSRSPKRYRDTSLPPPEEEKKLPIKPNYSQSGILSAESKKDSEGNVLKYHEPIDSTLPPKTPEYRIYIFSESKEGELIDTIKLNQKSHYLLGRDKKVCDIPIDIPSCSRQHAVIQFRRISKTEKYGETQSTIKPYIIDLESSYGTQLNHDQIPSSRYIELQNKDLIQFCKHKREYMFIES